MHLFLAHLKDFLNDLVRAIILRSNGWLFVQLCNYRFRFLGLDTRFSLEKSANGSLFRAEEDHKSASTSQSDERKQLRGKGILFNDKLQGFRTYKDGLEIRVTKLIHEYLLDGVNVETNSVIIDCGANVGDFYLALKEFGFDMDNCLYVGVEPEQKAFECLSQNVKSGLNQNLALWNQDSFLDLYLTTDLASSSLIRPPGVSEVRQIKVRTLDTLMDELGLRKSKVHLIKIEAEGCEPEVLQGSLETLKRARYVVIDAGPERGESLQNTLTEVVNFMWSKGFNLKQVNYPRLTALFEKGN